MGVMKIHLPHITLSDAAVPTVGAPYVQVSEDRGTRKDEQGSVAVGLGWSKT